MLLTNSAGKKQAVFSSLRNHMQKKTPSKKSLRRVAGGELSFAEEKKTLKVFYCIDSQINKFLLYNG